MASQPGPPVHGRQTTISILSRDALASSPLLPTITSLINVGFDGARLYVPPGFTRLDSPQAYLSELGPDSQILVLTFAEPDARNDEFPPHGLVAVCAWETLLPVREDAAAEGGSANERVNGLFRRSGETARQVAGVRYWTLKMMVVAPGCARQGVASVVLGLLERLIWEKSQADADGAAGSRVLIQITSTAEINESFYVRRGYEAVGRVSVPAGEEGVGGSLPFHVVHLDKWLGPKGD